MLIAQYRWTGDTRYADSADLWGQFRQSVKNNGNGLASLALDRRPPRGLRSRAVPTGLSVAPPNGFDKEQTPRFSYSTLLQAVDLGDMSIDQRSWVAHR